MSRQDRFLKRLFDLIASLIGLLLLWWMILIAFILATLDTRKLGFFVQDRVGKDGKLFRVIKIRTMRQDNGMRSTVTTDNDPRVTQIGNILRKTKIDELPQLLNVLNGTMSLVGPRPTVTEDVQRMSIAQRRRLEVHPGITGLAQINGNTALSWPERIKFDVYYIDNYSFLLDIQILLKTLAMVFIVRADTHPYSANEWETSMPNRTDSINQIGDIKE